MDSSGQREGLAQHVFDMFANTHDEANQLYDVLFEFALNNKKLFKDCSDFDEMTSEIRKGVTNKELLTLLHDYVPSEDMPDKLSDFMMWSPVLAFHEIENIYSKENMSYKIIRNWRRDEIEGLDLILNNLNENNKNPSQICEGFYYPKEELNKLRMIQDGFFNSLWLNAYVSLCSGCGTMLK